ncbi:MAG TPA: 5-carboxymethyl-2-hydroxymuconate Delta-isomerase [Burkholderiaceae bacterium]
MPHLVIQYTDNLEPDAQLTALTRKLADVLLAQRDAEGKAVFPTGGTRVLAYPCRHYAVADGQDDYAFVYLNLRIAPGRSAGAIERAGEALLAAVQAHFASLFASRTIGITLQIDEGAPVFDAKHSNLHARFAPAAPR